VKSRQRFMKILYDGDIYNWQAAGGINRYFEEIIGHLPPEFDPALLTLKEWPTNWPVHPRLKIYRGPSALPDRLARRFALYYFRALEGRLKPDVFHPTNYYSLTLRKPNEHGCPSVITVYDFTVELFPDHVASAQESAAKQREAILSADALICISHHTRQDLLERFPHCEDKITVTHLAGDLDISLSYGSEKIPEQPYFLFVGSRSKYKNFEGLLHAFARLEGAAVLAVAGSPWNEGELALLEKLKIAGQVEHLGRVSDAHLAKLYRCSLAFVYPSFYEGFGIPPLEAMNCETVVIAANTSSIPEVVGNSALLFDPHQEDELTERLQAVYRGEVNRAKLIEQGRERALLFSWEKTCEMTTQVYKKIV
jgi:glycosyltransferase involved in cell wall biosynthesis